MMTHRWHLAEWLIKHLRKPVGCLHYNGSFEHGFWLCKGCHCYLLMRARAA